MEQPKLIEVKVIIEVDECADLSYLGEFSNKAEKAHIDRSERERIDNTDYRYFNSGSGDLTFIDEEYKRMQQFIDGSVQSLYINAIAVVIYSIGSGCSRLETLQSGGLGGVDSDSTDEYKESIINGELADLKQHLQIFNVDVSNFEELAEGAKAAV